MLEKRLLADLPGFTIKGALIFIPPVEHTLRGFHFEGSDFDKTSFYIWRFFLPLTVPQNHLSFSFGDRLRIKGADRWSVKDSNFEKILADAMKDEIPCLNKLKRPEDVVEELMRLKDASKNPYINEAFAYMSARSGNFRAATEALENLLALLDPSVRWQRDMADRAQLLRRTLQLGSDQVMHQLKDWETESILNLGLEKYRKEKTSEI
jgi:hypothetical protein